MIVEFNGKNKHNGKKLFSLLFIVLVFIVVQKYGLSHAAEVQSFYKLSFSESDFSDVIGVQINSGAVALQPDQEVINEDFNGYGNGDVPLGWYRMTPDWSVNAATGAYHHSTYNYDSSVSYSDYIIGSGEVSSDVKLYGGEQMGGIIFRAQDDINYYLVSYSSLYDYVSIQKVVNGVFTTIKSISEPLENSTYYNLKVDFNNTHIKVYLDNVLKIEVDDNFLSNGKVGLWRTGTAIDADNFKASVKTPDSGYAESTTFNSPSFLNSVTLNNVSGTNVDNMKLLVSNDDGFTWLPIKQGETVSFEKLDDKFKYKVYFLNGISKPTLSALNLYLNTGDLITNSKTKLTDYDKLNYKTDGNSVIPISANPSSLIKYLEIPNTKSVLQTAIMYKNGMTIAYIPNSVAHTLIAYNLTDKVKLWEVNLGGYLETSLLIKDGVIYAGSYDQYLYAVDQDSGNILWRFQADNAISGGSTYIHNGKLYFEDYGYNGITSLYSIDITTHNLVWKYSIPAVSYMSSSLDEKDNRLYAIDNGAVYALDSEDGELIWTTPISGGYIIRQPVIYGDKLVIGSDNAITVMDKYTGAKKWQNKDGFTSSETGVGASPTISKGIVYYPSKADAKVYARRIDDGSLVWQTSVDDVSGTFSTPVITEDGFIYLSYNTGVRVFDKSTGQMVWKSAESGWAETNVSIGRGYMIFTDYEGSGTTVIYKINKETYISGDGLSVNRDERNISSITVDGMASSSFGCSADVLSERSKGSVEINYQDSPSWMIKPKEMIINTINDSSIHVCNPSGYSMFTHQFGQTDFNTILRDGLVMPGLNWRSNGSLVTISDHFSDHTYTLARQNNSAIVINNKTVKKTDTTSSEDTSVATNAETDEPDEDNNYLPEINEEYIVSPNTEEKSSNLDEIVFGVIVSTVVLSSSVFGWVIWKKFHH